MHQPSEKILRSSGCGSSANINDHATCLSQIAVVASKLAVARHFPSGDQLQLLIVL